MLEAAGAELKERWREKGSQDIPILVSTISAGLSLACGCRNQVTGHDDKVVEHNKDGGSRGKTATSAAVCSWSRSLLRLGTNYLTTTKSVKTGVSDVFDEMRAG